jgi:hypothetical protein
MDAEYQACGAAAWEGLSLGKALGEIALLSSDFPLGGPVLIRCDYKAALSLCKDRKEGQRVKHIDVIHHFARDHVASGELSFVYCKSEENVSDCLTKALSRPLFEKGERSGKTGNDQCLNKCQLRLKGECWKSCGYMHGVVGLGHSVTLVLVGSCEGET